MSKIFFSRAKSLLIAGISLLGLCLLSNPAHAAPRPQDRTPPTTPIVTDDGEFTTSTTTLHASWSSSDPDSGIKQYKYAIGARKGWTGVRRWTSVGLNTEVIASSLKLKSGKTYYFSVKAQNGAGKWSNTGFSNGIKVIPLETIPPQGSIKINNDTFYTNSPEVILSILAEDNPDGSGLDKMRFSNDINSPFFWSEWENYATTKNWQLSVGDGTKTVYAQFRDKAGNVSAAVSDTIILDMVPPAGRIEIAQGDFFNTPTVTLNLSAFDSTSGVSQMQFSEDNLIWTTPEPFAATRSWSFSPQEGLKTILVKFRDNAGNESIPSRDSGSLDTTPPIADAGPDRTIAVNSELAFSGASSSDNSGIASYSWDFGDGSSPASGAQVQHTYSQAADYTVTLSVTDLSGNGPVSDTALVRVSAEINHPPVLEPIGDKIFTLPSSGGSLNANPAFLAPELNSSGIERVSDDGPRTIKSSFAPDEIIVKFKSQASVAQMLRAEKVTTQETTQALIAQLTPLIQGYQIISIEPVFKDLEKATAKTTARISAVKYPARSRRAKLELKELKEPPPLEKGDRGGFENIPDLENIYKIKLSQTEKDKKNKGLSSNLEEILLGDELLRLCHNLEQSPNIAYAQPNYIRKANLIPNDPLLVDQWGLRNIQAEAAWDITTGSPNVLVGVIDTGFDYTHLDLLGNLWINPGEDLNHNGQVEPADFNGLDDDGNGKIDDLRGWDFNTIITDGSGQVIGRKPEDNDPSDIYGHGSLVSGVISAVTNNNLGIAGVSWLSRILVAKGLGDQGFGDSSNLANAIKYAADNGADIINMSFGGPENSPLEDDALSYAYNLGSLLVAAAGNDNFDASFQHPANNPQVIAVSATNPDDKKASFSNWGNKIELAAPGVDILSTASRLSPDNLESKLIVVSDNQRLLQSDAMEYSATTPQPGLTADLLFAGLGRPEDFVGQDFTGKIALIERGGLSFQDKVRNAASAGAIGAIIYNNVHGIFFGTLNAASSIPAVSLSQEDGQYLKTLLIQGPVVVNLSVLFTDYLRASGTSFSAPYVCGVASLILAQHPDFDNDSIQMALRHSADDLLNPISDGQDYPGFDIYSGYGRLNARKALELGSVAIAKISSPILGSAPAGIIDILGTAKGLNFLSYTLDYAEVDFASGRRLSDWSEIRTSTTPVTNGLLAQWDSSGIGLGSFRLRLRVRDLSNREFVEHVFLRKSVPHLPGWPIAVRGEVASSPAVGDLDGDGDLEVVVGSSDNRLYAWDHTGESLPGWPILFTRAIYSSPALADIDHDGDMEVVIGGGLLEGKVYAFHHNGTLVSGWPVVTGGTLYSSPAIADIDADGDLEIIVSADSANKLFAFHHDGSLVNGWPVGLIIPNSISFTPAVADLDGDGDLEIVIGSQDGKVHVFHHNGAVVSGWPVQSGSEIYSSVAIGDVDGNGDLEIVVFANGSIFILNHNGSRVSNWSIGNEFFSSSSPALADLDRDGDLEIVIGSEAGKIYGFHHDGTLVSGWPVETGSFVIASPAIGDIDADGDLEIVVGSTDGNIYAFQHNGILVPGWPLVLGEEGTMSSAAIADLDGDGDLEIVVGGGQQRAVYAFDQPGPGFAPYSIEWGKFRHNLKNSGLYPLKEAVFSFSIFAADIDGDRLTYSAANLPIGAGFDPESRSFSWRPSSADIGVYPNVHFEVSDGKGGLDSEEISITIR